MGWGMRRGKRVYYRKEWVPDPEARGGGRVWYIYRDQSRLSAGRGRVLIFF